MFGKVFLAEYIDNMITLTEIGYSHPSQANWSYGVWLIVDDTGAKLYKETFGGDSRLLEKLKVQGIEAKICYVPQVGAFKFPVRETEKMPDIEDYMGNNH